jgi:vacuolar-type H+-ATPase subunit I/STV1
MHQIQEEVLAPVIQNLMAENRAERLKIYNGIKDQKIDYLNQWHRDTEDFYGRNRAEAADLINRMRESYADYIRCLNTYKALQETQTAMLSARSLDATEVQQQNKDAEIIADFEVQAQQFQKKQEEFSEYMDRLKDNIDEKAAQFGYIPYYEATLRDKEYRDMAQSTGQLQELDPQRKKLLAMNPYVTRHAKLPPPPNIEQKLYDDFAIDLLKEASSIEDVADVIPDGEV